uniref:Uncharacterized protein n=1 Tax=Romanomermis culicivorax TaxID=13658 RepID=A0A915HF78_ROMCU
MLVRYMSAPAPGQLPRLKYLSQDNPKYTNKSAPGLRECSGDQNNGENVTEACIFDLQPFIEQGCSPPDFGFNNGTPCVILTLNKLIGWEPLPYPPDTLPSALPPQVQKNYKNGDVAITCEGEYIAGQENIGQLEYIPPSGIRKIFYPYKFRKDLAYHQPFAMVKFKSLRPGILVEVECKAYAYNIIHDRPNRLGMTHFEMLRVD